MNSLVFVMDVIGTVAFAISGAMVAIRKRMDIFGVCILALATATGGGAIRDLLIGKNPPMMFRNPIYVLISIVTACIVFFFMYFQKKEQGNRVAAFYEKVLFLCDSLGLAAFTVDGVHAGMLFAGYKNLFLVVFLGVITGVGGGVLRDIFAQEMPMIFVKQVYACASILGGIVTGVLWDSLGQNNAMMAGFIVTLLIRIFAAYFRWDLPKINNKYNSR